MEYGVNNKMNQGSTMGHTKKKKGHTHTHTHTHTHLALDASNAA